MIGTSLDANAAYHFPFGGTSLVFQKELMLKQREVQEDGEICLTHMDKMVI
jgi:hypothetical protein